MIEWGECPGCCALIRWERRDRHDQWHIEEQGFCYDIKPVELFVNGLYVYMRKIND